MPTGFGCRSPDAVLRFVMCAAVHGVEYLLTWNCKHIAKAAKRAEIEEVCRERGFEPPIICTPDELLEE